MKLTSIQKYPNTHIYCIIETDLDENKSFIVFSGSLIECHAYVSLNNLFTDKFSKEEMNRMYKYGETLKY